MAVQLPGWGAAVVQQCLRSVRTLVCCGAAWYGAAACRRRGRHPVKRYCVPLPRPSLPLSNQDFEAKMAEEEGKQKQQQQQSQQQQQQPSTQAGSGQQQQEQDQGEGQDGGGGEEQEQQQDAGIQSQSQQRRDVEGQETKEQVRRRALPAVLLAETAALLAACLAEGWRQPVNLG